MKREINARVLAVADIGDDFAIATEAMGLSFVLPIKKQDGLEIQAGDSIKFMANMNPNFTAIINESGVELSRNGIAYAKAALDP